MHVSVCAHCLLTALSLTHRHLKSPHLTSQFPWTQKRRPKIVTVMCTPHRPEAAYWQIRKRSFSTSSSMEMLMSWKHKFTLYNTVLFLNISKKGDSLIWIIFDGNQLLGEKLAVTSDTSNSWPCSFSDNDESYWSRSHKYSKIQQIIRWWFCTIFHSPWPRMLSRPILEFQTWTCLSVSKHF